MTAPPATRLVRAPSRFPGEVTLRLSSRDGWRRLSYVTELSRTHGDLVELAMPWATVVVVSHPDDIRDVLVTHGRSMHKGRALELAKALLGEGLLTSEGEFHLRQRRLAQPAFHRQRIGAYAEAMGRATAAVRDRWRDGAAVDIHAEMMELTLTIVAATLFGADVSGDSAEVSEALDAAFRAVSLGFAAGPLGMALFKLPLPSTRRFTRAKDALDAIIYRIIAERRRDGRDRGDLLSMLLSAQDDEGDGSGMTDRQLRDEVITLFLAGHETTANALAFAWLLLARHPDAAASLHAEVDRVLGDRVPTLDDLAAMPYTRAVVAETMRLYPPAYIVGRRAAVPVTVAGQPFPARTIFLVSQWVTHRDPRWWPEPEAFRPERWFDEAAAAARPKFAYFPFGGGTRICIGEQFAWMEAMLCLAMLARRWRVEVPGPDPALQPIITMRPKGGLPAVLRRR